MTVAADLEEGEGGGCERQAVVAPSPRKLHSVFNAGLGLAYGPMSYDTPGSCKVEADVGSG